MKKRFYTRGGIKDGVLPPIYQAAPDILQKIYDKGQSHNHNENNQRIKSRSDNDEGDACEVTSDEAGDLSYEYRPDDCAKPPDPETLEKGLEGAFEYMNKNLALVACFQGGALEGVLELAINPSHIIEGQCDDVDYERTFVILLYKGNSELRQHPESDKTNREFGESGIFGSTQV